MSGFNNPSAGMKRKRSSSPEVTWISRFCSRPGNEFFCEVETNYITEDNENNLFGLQGQVPNFHDALDMIMDVDQEAESDSDESDMGVNEAEIELLYGMIHARYILTDRGIARMIKKYESGDFGYCPRVYCENQAMLPVGLSDVPRQAMVKQYCPKCKDVYNPISSLHQNIDGAYFGPFPHMLFMVHPEKRPKPPAKQFDPKLFGFKIHSSSES